MKNTFLAAAAITVLSLPAAALAEDADFTFTGNVGLYSQYVFRGITQTDEDPAVQGGFDLGHSSGLYAGAWGSNISWISDFGSSDGGNSLELDVYAGYRDSIGETGLGYDLGAIYYWYPGDTLDHFDPDSAEIYGALTYEWIGLKVSWNLDNYFGYEGNTGSNDSDGSAYYDLYANIPVSETGITLNLHYGILDVKHDQASPSRLSYNDWKLGATWALPNGFSAGAYFTSTDADKDFYTTPTGTDTSDNQVVVFVSKAL